MSTDPRSPVFLAPHFAFLPIDSAEGEIRLLKVSPGRDSDAIQCSYEIANVNDNEDVPHETVSYVWGKMDSKRTILIDDMVVELTENLFNALRRVRHATRNRYLWVDALCINQEDDAEKAAQVNIMHRIFSRCARCNIWMGNIDAAGLGVTDSEAVEAARGALDVIRILAGEDIGRNLYPYLATTTQHIQAGKALKILMAAPWWTRIWTVQEATSPWNLNVLWGPLSIPWHLLMKASEELVEGNYHAGERLDYYDIFPEGNSAFLTGPIIGLRIASEWAVEPESTLNMLWRFRYRDSTDPRDKVFVILNLVAEGLCPLPSVSCSDYGISTPVLFRRVMLDLLREEHGLRPLISMRGERKSTPGLPSWVIDWSLPHEWPPLARFWEHNYFYFSYTADRGLPMLDRDEMISPEYGENVLNLNGLFYDKVLACSDVIAEGEEEDQLQQMCTELIAMALAEQSHHRIISEVYCRQALTDIIEGNFADETDIFEGEPADEYWRHNMFSNQRLFITENGEVGLGPSTTSVGDEVWILSGGRSPFLLSPLHADREDRKTQDRDALYHYLFRGDVFVPGIENGEAVESRIENQRFVHIH
ncbi:HET-domain-containing protein [Xylariaceae sp. AK1471]|nr:HET-domain-containing protein [Xylariaceae sp. AK1471]